MENQEPISINQHKNQKSLKTLVDGKKRPDLASLYEIEPSICGLGIYMDIQDSPQLDSDIYVNGSILLGPSFHKKNIIERAYILARGILHNALGHPKRMKEMIAQNTNFSAKLFTIAAHAIINDALSEVEELERGLGRGVTTELLAHTIPNARLLSVEGLYRELRKLYPEEKDIPDYFDRVELDLGPGENRLGQEHNCSPEEWNERLRRGFGKYPQGLARLLNNMEKSTVKWETVLKSYIASAVGTKERLDPSRPHRRWLAMEYGWRQAGGNMPMLPGNRPQPQARIAIAIDTSGSISRKLLERFLGEIVGIMRQLDIAVRVITADASVHQCMDFTDPAKLAKFVPRGGGGTSFEESINKAEEYKPSILIYFTDLEGPAPRKPRFPVLWAVPKGTYTGAPFGKMLELF